MTAPTAAFLVVIAFFFLLLLFVYIYLPHGKTVSSYGAAQSSSCRTPQTPQLPLSPGSTDLGGYTFIANGFDDYEVLRPLIDDLMDNCGMQDFQFYDWFANYSGMKVFGPKTPSPSPQYQENWWNCETWKDGYELQRDIKRVVVYQAVQQIHAKGGRAWAYVQAQASEDLHLADPPQDQIKQLGNSFTHGNGGSMVGGYLQNAALANYQCEAWMQPVLDLGFFGIHWDLFDATHHDTSIEFIKTAADLLRQKGLRQTFNDINLNQNIDQTLFGTGPDNYLYFPYTEVWSDEASDRYVQLQAENKVVMAYPASCPYGVPPPKDRSCTTPFCKNPQLTCCDDIYTPTPGCTTPWQLAAARVKKYQNLKPRMRYCLYGIGQEDGTNKIIVGMMRSEYFPIVYAPQPPSQLLTL